MIEVYSHSPFSFNSGGRSVSKLSSFACPNQVQCLSFSIVSSEDIADIRIYPESLTNSSNEISSKNIDIFIAHVWEQAGLASLVRDPVKVPELLLKDDRVHLEDSYSRKLIFGHKIVSFAERYCPPKVRLTGDVETNLIKGKSKQIFVNLHIPKSVKPGKYKGIISISSKDLVLKEVEVDIDVLPITLIEPSQDRLMWFKASLDPRNIQHYVPKRIYKSQLKDIYGHGFTSITIHETKWSYAKEAIEIAEEVGFNRNIVLVPPFPLDASKIEAKKASIIFYISDELDAHGKRLVPFHQENWRIAKRYKANTMLSILDRNFERKFFDENEIGHPPETISYYLPQNLEFAHVNSILPDSSLGIQRYYYWLCHMEKPNLHRALAGFCFFASRMDGISPYSYQHLPLSPSSPYNDFDPWEPNFNVLRNGGQYRQHMTTYPARDGSIPTLQWEGLRQGIVDLKYISTLSFLIRQAKERGDRFAALAKEIEIEIDKRISNFNLRTITIDDEVQREPYTKMNEDFFDDVRREIAESIILLSS